MTQRPSTFDRLVVRSLPYVPRGVVARVAGRYLAGESIDDVTRTVAALNGEGATATVDVLGEDVTTADQALAATSEYLRLVDHLAANDLDSNVSVKLTMLGLKLDESLAEQNLARVARRAADFGNFVRIDMEDHSCTDATLRIYRRLRPQTDNIGIVLQAMLHRTLRDIDLLCGGDQGPVNVRLVKGIYREPAEIALVDPDQIRDSFVACLERLLDGGCHVGIASHDEELLHRSLALVQRLGLDRQQYELQMLLGVLPPLRRRLIDAGHRMRVYVPYGADWYAYSLRRLRENPTVARHVMRALFRRQ